MKIYDRRTLLKTPIFEVEQFSLQDQPGPSEHPWYRLLASDWVNVLPVTPDGQALLIRQPRAGVLRHILECPGGTLDEGETDPTLAAARELEEETGHRSTRILSLGSIHTNPAIISNRIHFFLALDCKIPSDRRHFPDPSESIEIVAVPLQELETMVRTGQVDHALCALCILLARPYLQERMK